MNWQLVVQAYGFIGILETVCAFSMGYWYAQRQGIQFSTLWFGFNSVEPGFTKDEQQKILNVASSIYFVTLVVMRKYSRNENGKHVQRTDGLPRVVHAVRPSNPATVGPQAAYELVLDPGYLLRPGVCDFLPVSPGFPWFFANGSDPSRTLVSAYGFWDGYSFARRREEVSSS